MKLNNLARIYLALGAFLLAALILLAMCTDLFHPFLHPRIDNAIAAVSDKPDQNNTKKIVVLDAGHGGEDSGATSADGVLEKDLNLKISKKIAHYLSLFQIDTVLTRSDDHLPQTGSTKQLSRKQNEMLCREQIAARSNADLFLSIHMNSYPDSVCRGAQVFYTEQNPQNEVLAAFLQNSVAAVLQPENRRVIKSTSQIYLLNRLKMPAALIECGFLSTPDEVERFTDEEYQDRFSFLLAASIAGYLYRDPST